MGVFFLFPFYRFHVLKAGVSCCVTTVISTLHNDDTTVVMKYDTQALKMEKGKKVKCLLSECHLGDRSDHGNKKCVSKESLG